MDILVAWQGAPGASMVAPKAWLKITGACLETPETWQKVWLEVLGLGEGP